MKRVKDVISRMRKHMYDTELVAVPMHSLEDKLGLPLIRVGQGRNLDYYPRYMIEQLEHKQDNNAHSN